MRMKKILVVGAGPGFVDALVREKRWDVHTAPAGPSALCRAHDLRPDLLIAEGKGLDVARTLGWVSATPSLLLSDVPGPRPGEIPSARLVLERSCDGETLVRSVGDLLA